MKNQFFLACLISLSLAAYTFDSEAKCACSDVSDQTTCTSFGCKWDGSSCTDKACSDYTTQPTCDSSADCSWTNAGACAAFTACADYSVTVANDCNGKGNTSTACVANATAGTDGKFACKTYTAPTPTYVTCSTLAATTCMGKESADKACAWKANDTTPSCVALTMTQCSDANKFSEQVCEYTGFCTWVSSTNTCQMAACSDSTTLNTCVAVPTTFGAHTATLCLWENSKCSDADDTTKLTATECPIHTGFTHLWNSSSSTCDECSGYSGILSLVAGLILLLA